jgi:4'-phosphopantetheinyl transferase
VAGTADVWWARRQDAAPRLARLLDETEQQRHARFRRQEDKDRFLVGCALAKTVLAGYAGPGHDPASIRFDRTCPQCGRPHGKPHAADSDLQHSVSHSGELIAVAVAHDPVGIDVEHADGRQAAGQADPDALARLVFSGAERAVLTSADPSTRARGFLVAWTRKEAVTKATGDGLRVAFSQFVVAADAGPPRVLSWPYPQPPDQVSLRDLDPPAPGYLAALAVIGPCHQIRERDGSPLLAAV